MLVATSDHPALCMLLPTFLIHSKLLLSHHIPGLPLYFYQRSHFEGTVTALLACQQFLMLMKCQGVKPNKWRVFLVLGR